jgi:NAD(P)-dependent dehydrogenase (short-subunit alcohol dehydrogenase family)
LLEATHTDRRRKGAREGPGESGEELHLPPKYPPRAKRAIRASCGTVTCVRTARRTKSMADPVCAIVGIGPGNGAAFARRFAAEGHRVALCSRSLETLEKLAAELPGARAYAYDATDAESARQALDRIRDELGPIATLVYNAGSGVFGSVDDIDLDTFQRAWEVNARGLFLATKAVIPGMREAGGGNIVVIGATASKKGGAAFAAFASAKAAQRGLTESLARKLGPEHIHVSYVIIDGVIDIPRTRAMLKDRPDDFFLRADDIAEAVFFLTRQSQQAWTFELDLRPFGEKW